MTGDADSREDQLARLPWSHWPDVAVGVLVAGLGLFEAASAPDAALSSSVDRLAPLLVALSTAVAAALGRRAPGIALGTVWLIFTLQLACGIPLLLVQLAAALVAFGAARWGSRATLWASALSLPAAGLVVLLIVRLRGRGVLAGLVAHPEIESAVRAISDRWEVTAGVIGLVALGAPWLIGLALRFSDHARLAHQRQLAAEEEAARAVREREQAREIARLREDQAQLAGDVHDVVGHSLAVILAQAESAHYVQEPEALKKTAANIATAARRSLQDVRQVLSQNQHQSALPGTPDSLIEGVRASGHEVIASVLGEPQPLPPDVELVAFRVLQEMLTNAVKHGRRSEVVHVEHEWADDVRIQVRNVIGQEPGPITEGRGVEGMRRRVESLGGRLDVGRGQGAEDQIFTATAWLPHGEGRR